jgi:DNA polymerase-3 subunit beta
VKFQAERDTLADAVAWAARALPARPAAPVLAGMRLAVTGNTLALSTFDYEVSAQASVPVDGGEDGTVLVSGRLLAEIFKALPARPVEMATDGSFVTLKCGTAKFTLYVIAVDEYPALPDMPPESGKVGADLLAQAIGQVAVAAGRDDTLPALTGIRVEIDGPRVTLVATDRYRLAVRTFQWEPLGPETDAVSLLVPARTLTEAARAFGGSAEVTIGLDPHSGDASGGTGIIGWEASGRQTTTRLLAGEYPRYQALLPTEFSAVAELAVGPFTEAVKRVALVAERNTPVRLTFATEGLLLEAGAGDEALAMETVECDYDGEELRVNFNPSYLLDGLGAIGSDMALISFTTPTRPAVLTGKDGGDGYRYVLMPIRSAG